MRWLLEGTYIKESHLACIYWNCNSLSLYVSKLLGKNGERNKFIYYYFFRIKIWNISHNYSQMKKLQPVKSFIIFIMEHGWNLHTHILTNISCFSFFLKIILHWNQQISQKTVGTSWIQSKKKKKILKWFICFYVYGCSIMHFVFQFI